MSLLNTLFRTLILDDAAYQEWRERPNLFLRGIVLIVVVSLVAGLASFAVNLVQRVRPVDTARIETEIDQALEQQFRWNPGWQDPEFQEVMDEMVPMIIGMATDIAEIEAPLPRGVGGFFEAVGGWLSGAMGSLWGWLFYGALVLIAVNLLGGSAKLPDFMGMVSLSTIPSLLTLINPVLPDSICCLSFMIWLVALAWTIVVYVKAVSVTSDLDVGQAILAVFAPFVVLVLLGILLSILTVMWMVIVL